MTNPIANPSDPDELDEKVRKEVGGSKDLANLMRMYSTSLYQPPSGSYVSNATLHASTALSAMHVIERHSLPENIGTAVDRDVRLAEVNAAAEGQRLAHERYTEDLKVWKEVAAHDRRTDRHITYFGAFLLLAGLVYYGFTRNTVGITVGVSAGLTAFGYRTGKNAIRHPKD